MILASIFLSTLSEPAFVLSAGAPVQDVGAQTAPAHVEHGKLIWFQGSYAELLAEATKAKKIVFMDFWASW